MRRLDELVALEVRSFEPFGPVTMHDSIEHDFDPREIADRFKDGGVFQQRKNAGKWISKLSESRC